MLLWVLLFLVILILSIRVLRSCIYDTIIAGMTSKWYKEVLSRLNESDYVLDIGIGTILG